MAKEETTASEAPAAPAPKAASPWPALIAVLVLMPVLAFGMTQYFIVPGLKAAVAQQVEKSGGTGSEDSSAHGATGAKTAHEKGKEKPAFTYEFKDIVVNLSGAMGTRYLKATFTVSSSNAELQKIMAENKNQLLDTALNVLSSKSLADLEVAGSKNLVRNDLQMSLNQALGSEVIEQIYFSEFVVQ